MPDPFSANTEKEMHDCLSVCNIYVTQRCAALRTEQGRFNRAMKPNLEVTPTLHQLKAVGRELATGSICLKEHSCPRAESSRFPTHVLARVSAPSSFYFSKPGQSFCHGLHRCTNDARCLQAAQPCLKCMLLSERTTKFTIKTQKVWPPYVEWLWLLKSRPP